MRGPNRIIATGSGHKPLYDLQSDKLSSVDDAGERISFLSAHGRKRVIRCPVKEFIVIKHTPTADRLFTLEWNGKICLPSPVGHHWEDLRNWNLHQSHFKAQSATPPELSPTSGNGAQANRRERKPVRNHCRTTASLSFSTSSIYRIYRQGKPVAEVCRYLPPSPPMLSLLKAIVVYSGAGQ